MIFDAGGYKMVTVLKGRGGPDLVPPFFIRMLFMGSRKGQINGIFIAVAKLQNVAQYGFPIGREN